MLLWRRRRRRRSRRSRRKKQEPYSATLPRRYLKNKREKIYNQTYNLDTLGKDGRVKKRKREGEGEGRSERKEEEVRGGLHFSLKHSDHLHSCVSPSDH